MMIDMAPDASPSGSADDGGGPPGRPLSRAEQQDRTRVALVQAAEVVFARDGFHGASLDSIAREAGYSKGAIYSNFDSKADLFLAVMDRLVEGVDDHWAPMSQTLTPGDLTQLGEVRFDQPPTPLQVSRGFSLATLEFAAAAGRDEGLRAALRDRLAVLVEATAGIVAARRSADETLGDDELALLITAFDQGMGLFALLGWPVEDTTIMPKALARLLHPAPDEVAPG